MKDIPLSPIGPHEPDGPSVVRAWAARALKEPALFERVRLRRAKVARQGEEARKAAERRRLARKWDEAAWD